MTKPLFKMAPKCSGDVPSRAPKRKKAPKCLTEKICVRQASVRHELVLSAVSSGREFNAVNCEFDRY